MHTLHARLLGVLTLVLILFAPCTSDAEWFGDIYLGASHTDADDNNFTLSGTVVRPLEGTDASTPGGGRIGYWFEQPSWIGAALDVSVFDLNFDGAPPLGGEFTLTELPISALLFLRYPAMTSDEFPNGRLQPYVAAGPSLVLNSISEFVSGAIPPPAVLEDTSLSLGFDFRAGATWLFREGLGVFLEYRYLEVQPTLESATGGGTVRYEPTFRTQAGAVGVTFRF